jgi:hypothetical protein
MYSSIVNEFASTLATAKAAGKKTLLLVPSVDSTSPVGLNPIIKQEKLAEQLVDIIKNRACVKMFSVRITNINFLQINVIIL